MKTTILLFTVLFLILNAVSLRAQVRRNLYRIEIEFLNDRVIKGDLYALNDSSIRMRKYRPMVDTVFSISEIRTISVLRRTAPAKGFLAGFGVGAGVGAAIGYVTYTPPSCDGFCLDLGPGVSAIGAAVAGGILGGLMGLAVRSAFREFPVNGAWSAYNEFREKISEESVTRSERRRIRKGSTRTTETSNQKSNLTP